MGNPWQKAARSRRKVTGRSSAARESVLNDGVFIETEMDCMKSRNRPTRGVRRVGIALALSMLGVIPAFSSVGFGPSIEAIVQVDGQMLQLNGAGDHVINRIKV